MEEICAQGCDKKHFFQSRFAGSLLLRAGTQFYGCGLRVMSAVDSVGQVLVVHNVVRGCGSQRATGSGRSHESFHDVRELPFARMPRSKSLEKQINSKTRCFVFFVCPGFHAMSSSAGCLSTSVASATASAAVIAGGFASLAGMASLCLMIPEQAEPEDAAACAGAGSASSPALSSPLSGSGRTSRARRPFIAAISKRSATSKQAARWQSLLRRLFSCNAVDVYAHNKQGPTVAR